MLLADVDWASIKEIVSMIAQVLTLALVTLGTAWGIYIGYRTKALEKEQKKQGRSNRRKLDKLTDETLGQNQKLDKIDKQGNGLTERLVKEASERAYLQGKHDAAKETSHPQTVVNVPDGGSVEVTDTTTNSKIVIPPMEKTP